MIRRIASVFIILFLAKYVYAQEEPWREDVERGEIKVTSSAFNAGGTIPEEYGYYEANISPPLNWSGIPKGTKSIALICDDPDAPIGPWVHWVIFNIPPDMAGLPENVNKLKMLDNGIVQGRNDFNKIGYGGPCPPSGTHRYFFKIYALDTMLDQNLAGVSKQELLEAMEGHILAKGELVGLYYKK